MSRIASSTWTDSSRSRGCRQDRHRSRTLPGERTISAGDPARFHETRLSRGQISSPDIRTGGLSRQSHLRNELKKERTCSRSTLSRRSGLMREERASSVAPWNADQGSGIPPHVRSYGRAGTGPCLRSRRLSGLLIKILEGDHGLVHALYLDKPFIERPGCSISSLMYLPQQAAPFITFAAISAAMSRAVSRFSSPAFFPSFTRVLISVEYVPSRNRLHPAKSTSIESGATRYTLRSSHP